MDITVYKDRDNDQVFEVDRTDSEGQVSTVDLDEAGVTKVELTAGGTMLSSNDGAITWSGTVITIKGGDTELPPGEYPALMVFYQPGAPRGKVKLEVNLVIKRGS